MESITYKDHLHDKRVDCYSILCTVSVRDYLSFIEEAWKSKGGIAGQRAPLKTKSAQRIRRRMIDDLSRGTVIPAIVVGVKVNEEIFNQISKNVPGRSIELLKHLKEDHELSIIDGMQRTTALNEAGEEQGLDMDQLIRIEFWVAKSTNSLIYRMLVLNTGQIPWNIKRQLEVVFAQFRDELENRVTDLKLLEGDAKDSRDQPGKFQASQFVELFMLFGTRRVTIDLQEQLAEEFARLDIIETTGKDGFVDIFVGISQLLVNLDKLFSSLTRASEIPLAKFPVGQKIFSSQPARAGFMVACSQDIFGIPGIDIPFDQQMQNFQAMNAAITDFIERNTGKSQEELMDIIDLQTLDEQTNIKNNKIGEFERNYFLKAFKTFIDLNKQGTLSTMTPCWRSSF